MYGQEELYASGPNQMLDKSSVSFRKRVELEVEQLKSQLEKKQEMLKLLDENPVIEKFMDLSGRY